LTPDEFYKDAWRSKCVLEDISGRRVLGYRTAGFSISKESAWAFDELLRAEYIYDSSVFPARRGHGGWPDAQASPYWVNRDIGALLEFPMTTANILGMPICFFGGGYLRFFPMTLIRMMTTRVLRQGRPAIFYVHPREIDPEHPHLKMSRWRTFKSYVNLESTEPKLKELLARFQFTTLGELTRQMEAAPVSWPSRAGHALAYET
jgi:polysaccharide deacetylase family protein (PEP-CTERM system associated)